MQIDILCFGQACSSIVVNFSTKWCLCQLTLVSVRHIRSTPFSWRLIHSCINECSPYPKSNPLILRLTILKFSFGLVFSFFPKYSFTWSWCKFLKVGWKVVSPLLDCSFCCSLPFWYYQIQILLVFVVLICFCLFYMSLLWDFVAFGICYSFRVFLCFDCSSFDLSIGVPYWWSYNLYELHIPLKILYRFFGLLVCLEDVFSFPLYCVCLVSLYEFWLKNDWLERVSLLVNCNVNARVVLICCLFDGVHSFYFPIMWYTYQICSSFSFLDFSYCLGLLMIMMIELIKRCCWGSSVSSWGWYQRRYYTKENSLFLSWWLSYWMTLGSKFVDVVNISVYYFSSFLLWSKFLIRKYFFP